MDNGKVVNIDKFTDAEKAMLSAVTKLSEILPELGMAQHYLRSYRGKFMLDEVKKVQFFENDYKQNKDVKYLLEMCHSTETTVRELCWWTYKQIPRLQLQPKSFYIKGEGLWWNVFIDHEREIFSIRSYV